MPAFNQVTILGNICQDIQVKYLPSGAAVTSFSLAINEPYNDKTTGQKVNKTIFVDVVAWNRTAEVIGEYATKGQPLLVSGKLSLNEWVDKTTQQKRSKLQVTALSIQLLGQRGDAPRGEEPQETPQEYSQEPPVEPAPSSSDVPF